MSTIPTSPPKKRRSPPVPLLLSSFPAPPSHIPPTPTPTTSAFTYASSAGSVGNNPPPCAPPSTPLPPVPGPSRISEHEQILLLAGVAPTAGSGNTTPRSASSLTHSQSLTSSSSAAAAARRQSRYSTLSLSAVTGHAGSSPNSNSLYHQQQPLQQQQGQQHAQRQSSLSSTKEHTGYDAAWANNSPKSGNGGAGYSINAVNNVHIITTAHSPNNSTTTSSNTPGHTAASSSSFSTSTSNSNITSISTTATTTTINTTTRSSMDTHTPYPRTPPTQIISLATQSPSPFTSPNTSRMLAASPLPGTQLTRISVSPMPLSDIDDFESGSEAGDHHHHHPSSFSMFPNSNNPSSPTSTPARLSTSTRRKRTPPPKRVPSPVIPLSARKQMRHAHNESISEIDIRDLMDLDDLGYASEEGDGVGDLSGDFLGGEDEDLGFVVKGGSASWNGNGNGRGKRDSVMEMEEAYDYHGRDWTPTNSQRVSSLSESGGKRFSFGGTPLSSSTSRRVSSGGSGSGFGFGFGFGSSSSGSGTATAHGAQSPPSNPIRLSEGFSPRSSISTSQRHHKYTSIADPIDPDAVKSGYSMHAVRESVDLLAGFGRSGKGRAAAAGRFSGAGAGDDVDEFGGLGRERREEEEASDEFGDASNLKEFGPRSRDLNGRNSRMGEEPTSPTPSRRSSTTTRHKPSHTIDRISQMFSRDVREEGERESGALWRASMSKDGEGEVERRGGIRESVSTMTQLSGVTMGESASDMTLLSTSTSTVRRFDDAAAPPPALGLGLEESPDLSGSSFTASSSPSFYTANGESREDLPQPPADHQPSPDPNSLSPKSLHLSLRAERTRSKGLKQVLQVRHRSRSRGRLANGDMEGPKSEPPAVPLPDLPGGAGALKARPTPDLEQKAKEEAKDDVLDGLEEMGRRVSGLGVGSLREKRVGERRRGRGSEEGGAGGVEMTMDELGLGPPPAKSQGVAFPGSAALKTPSQSQKLRPQAHRKEASDARSSSPDIEDILSCTPKPRPRAKSNGRYANSLLSRSSTSTSSASFTGDKERTRLRSFASVSALSDKSSFEGVPSAFKSVGASGKRRVSESSGPGAGRESWVDHGFGLPGDEESRERKRTMSNEVSEGGDFGEVEQRRDELEDMGGDSDSSLDLHTPLPHLMLRHGLLSPHSKLLPQSASRATTPALGGDGRPGSGMSFMSAANSVVTKSGIIKDERDTPKRRVRHRDGKLLRGGIGLTTGLGWSDSEDEDAPSPLTRRLSQLNLQRRASSSSIGTNVSYLSQSANGYSYSTAPVGRKQPHPLTRSYSYDTLNDPSEFGAVSSKDRADRSLSLGEFGATHYEDDEFEEDRTLQSTGEWAQRHRKPSAPPTSWHGRGAPPSASRPTSGSGSLGPSSRRSSANSGTGFGYRTSTSSFNSTRERSEEVDEHGRLIGGSMTKRSGSGRSVNTSANRESVGSAASASHSYSGSGSGSSGSIGPVTPHDSTSLTTGLSSLGRRMDKEKSLPPLPSSLKKPRVTSASSTASTGAPGGIPRPRTVSSTSSTAGSGLRKPSAGSINTSNTTTTTTTATTTKATASPHVRPLQLPRQAGRLGGGVDRAPVPVPSISTSNSVTSIPRSPSSINSPPSSSISSIRTPLSATNPHSGLSISSSRSFGRLSSSTYNSGSVPSSPMAPPSPNPMSPNGKPQPRTGTGMVYKSSTSKMRAPMVLSSSTSVGNLKTISRG